MRARLALSSAGIKVALREVVLRDKPPEMIEASPKATVPVLVLTNSDIIDESLDVMKWALAQNDPEGWLHADLEQIADLIETFDGPFKHHLDRYKYANRYDGAVVETHRTEAAVFLHNLDTRLAETEWLCGPKACLADYAILPFVRQFANTDREWFDNQDWPHLKIWLENFLASERFQSVMNKYPQWRAGEPEVDFPTSFA
jgi:glutathione S-transferase